MRPIFRVCVVSILTVVLLSGGTIVPAWWTPSPTVPPPFSVQFEPTPPTVLNGERAKLFVAQLNATNKTWVAAQKRSAERLRARGYRPTDVFVVHILNPPRRPNPIVPVKHVAEFFAPRVHAQTYESAEGWAVFSSW